MSPFIQNCLYAIIAYFAISILFHAWLASQIRDMKECDKVHRKKLEEMHRKLDELGWATKQGIHQARQEVRQHDWQAHTGLNAI